jgi:hypothetical protein
MSQIQNGVKDLLLQMMNGRWPTLGQHEQALLASWATMFTMVVDFADLRTQAVTLEERDLFRRTLRPPPNWLVWCGLYSGVRWHTNFWHKGMAYTPERKAPPKGIAFKCDTQVTTFALGKLLFQTASSTSDFAGPLLEGFDYPQSFDLRKLWPSSAPPTNRPARIFNDRGFEQLANIIRDGLRAGLRGR